MDECIMESRRLKVKLHHLSVKSIHAFKNMRVSIFLYLRLSQRFFFPAPLKLETKFSIDRILSTLKEKSFFKII